MLAQEALSQYARIQIKHTKPTGFHMERFNERRGEEKKGKEASHGTGGHHAQITLQRIF